MKNGVGFWTKKPRAGKRAEITVVKLQTVNEFTIFLLLRWDVTSVYFVRFPMNTAQHQTFAISFFLNACLKQCFFFPFLLFFAWSTSLKIARAYSTNFNCNLHLSLSSTVGVDDATAAIPWILENEPLWYLISAGFMSCNSSNNKQLPIYHLNWKHHN